MINFLIIIPSRCTNFLNLFLAWNSTCFAQFLCPSSGVFQCTHYNGICHTGLETACEQDQDVPSWYCSRAVSKPVWHITLLCVQWKFPDDGERNCPKHVEFYFKNKFEKSVNLVGFIIRKYLCAFCWYYCHHIYDTFLVYLKEYYFLLFFHSSLPSISLLIADYGTTDCPKNRGPYCTQEAHQIQWAPEDIEKLKGK